MQLSELLLNRQLYRAVQETSTQDAGYMSANNSQSVGSAYASVTTGAGEAAYAINSNTPTVSGTKIRAGYIDSENYVYVSGNFTVAGMRIDLNNGAIYAKNFAILSNGDAFFTGNISATSGTIGGWVISNNALSGQGVGTIQTSASTSVDRMILSGPNNALEFWNSSNVKVGIINTFNLSGQSGISLLSTSSAGDANVSVGGSGVEGNAILSVAPSANFNDMTFGIAWNGGIPSSMRIVGSGFRNGLFDWAPFDMHLVPYNNGGYGVHNLGSNYSLGGVQQAWGALYLLPTFTPSLDVAPGQLIFSSSLQALQIRTTSGWQTVSTGSVSLTLSALSIDTNKNWNNYGISNVGSVSSNGTVSASLFGGTSTEYMGSSIGSGIRVTNTGLTVYGSNGLFLSGSNKIDFQSYTLTMDSDKLAIVQTSEGFNALHCIEAPDVWFMDFCDVKGVLDPMFEEVTVPPYKYIKCEDDGGYQVWGKRKGHDHKRFESKTREEFDANERFLRMNQPNYQIGLRRVEGV